MINTDWERNIKHIRPFLGVMLVFSVALLVYLAVHRSTSNLVDALQQQPATGLGVEGTISMRSNGAAPFYGSLITFDGRAVGSTHASAQTYVTVVCFQGSELVYQFNAKPGVKFLLTDPLEPGFNWDGGPASCNASLIYRVPGETQAELYMLDSMSFDVEARA